MKENKKNISLYVKFTEAKEALGKQWVMGSKENWQIMYIF